MIASCYDLRLQCDALDCCHGPYGQRVTHEFTGEYGSACRAAARRAGWWIDMRNGICACPTCARAGHRPTEPI